LLDAFVPGSHGGTGQTFDWSLIPPALPVPVVLSGGLDAANVATAIRHVRPWAVDVSSGVEIDKGIKDAAKIAAFMRGVRDADV
jgi:phosphoribosylanthranilate isomerase